MRNTCRKYIGIAVIATAISGNSFASYVNISQSNNESFVRTDYADGQSETSTTNANVAESDWSVFGGYVFGTVLTAKSKFSFSADGRAIAGGCSFSSTKNETQQDLLVQAGDHFKISSVNFREYEERGGALSLGLEAINHQDYQLNVYCENGVSQLVDSMVGAGLEMTYSAESQWIQLDGLAAGSKLKVNQTFDIASEKDNTPLEGCDFIVRKNGCMVPLEVKSGEILKVLSAHANELINSSYKDQAVRFSFVSRPGYELEVQCKGSIANSLRLIGLDIQAKEKTPHLTLISDSLNKVIPTGDIFRKDSAARCPKPTVTYEPASQEPEMLILERDWDPRDMH